MNFDKYKANLHIDGNKVISYNTEVGVIDWARRECKVDRWWSRTTTKHINYACTELGLTIVGVSADNDQDK